MTENHVDPAVIKKTQETLGKFIKKPVLTEKLLKRPPFRFIHDIIISVIKETGYFNGLFTKEELNSENIKDRDGKMQFLQKLIDVIKIALNEDLSIRASKIVAGHEAEKTNELLQAIGKIIEQKIDLTKAIDTIKTGKQTKPKSKVKEVSEKKAKPSSEIKNERKDKEKIKDKNEKEKVKKSLNEKDVQKIGEKKKVGEKDLKTKVKTKTKDTSGDKQKPIKRISSIDKTVNNKESKLSKKKNEEEKSKPSQENVLTENVRKARTINGQEIEKNVEPVKQEFIENVPVKENETIQKERRKSSNSSSTEINAILSKAQNQQVSDEKSLQSDSRKNSASKNHTKQKSANKEKRSDMEESHNDRKLSANQDSITITNEPNSFSRDDISSKTNSQDEQKSPNISSDAIETKSELQSPINSQISSTKQNQKIKSQPIKPLAKDLKRQSTFVRETTNDELNNRPKTSLRPPSVRPASARPGAPRRRDKNVEIVLEPSDQVKMAGINVKLENFNAELEDDGENLVIIENSDNNQNDLKLENNEKNIEIIDENSQQGHLVQQILETQKELIQTSGVEINSETDLLDIGTLQKRQSSAKQMDSLRDIIQNLTRSINPLGKLMDFIPEDIDSMQLELTMWRDAYLQAANELKKERMQTESSIEPMKNQLEQLDANIKEYTEMINATRARILANSQKISSLLLEQ